MAPAYGVGGLPAAATATGMAPIATTTTTTDTRPTTTDAAAQPAPPPTPAPIRRQSPAWKVTPPKGSDCPGGAKALGEDLVNEPWAGVNAHFPLGSMEWVVENGNTYLRRSTPWVPGYPGMLQSPYFTPQVARLYVSFDVRGDFVDRQLAVGGPDGLGAWWIVPAAQANPAVSAETWRTVVVDLTDANNVNAPATNNQMAVQWLWFGTGGTHVDIDNVRVYQCTPTPSREPGDLNGDGLADAKFVMPSGDLLCVAGAPYPLVPQPVWRGGVGFDSFTWLTAAGDVTGDGLTDLLTRAGNGDLLVYAGDGVRTFPTARKVGNGWQWMRWILPVGDVDGNGRQDLIAGSTDGYMRFYSFRADGLLEGGRIVGNGWNIFTHVVAIRSEPALATPTRLYGITRSGDMLSYTVTATGNMYGTGTKVGNGWFFPKVASAGDMDGDGLDDVVAVASDGHAYVYPTLGQGRWKGRITLPGTGWNQAKLVG